MKCYNSEFDDDPEVTAYIQVKDNTMKNNDKVLQEMKDVPESDRTSRFRCVLALVGEGLEETFGGACEGKLLFERQGSGGFGYDPLFLPNESDSTFAEISLTLKFS